MEDPLIRHLIVADMRMRELFGFYWHGRHRWCGDKHMDKLVKQIKTGEKILAKLRKGQREDNKSRKSRKQ